MIWKQSENKRRHNFHRSCCRIIYFCRYFSILSSSTLNEYSVFLLGLFVLPSFETNITFKTINFKLYIFLFILLVTAPYSNLSIHKISISFYFQPAFYSLNILYIGQLERNAPENKRITLESHSCPFFSNRV